MIDFAKSFKSAFVSISVFTLAVWTAEAKPGNESEVETFKDWVVIQNKIYGWEIKRPKCWDPQIEDDVPDSESASVELQPQQKCKDKLPVNTGISIDTPHSIPLRPEEGRIQEYIATEKHYGNEVFVREIAFSGRKVKLILSQVKAEPGGSLNFPFLRWNIQGSCNPRNLYFGIMLPLEPAQVKRPLMDQKLPPVIEKIMSTFKCHRP
jgi:hypothetical protein